MGCRFTKKKKKKENRVRRIFFVQRHFAVHSRRSQHPFLPYLNPVGAAWLPRISDESEEEEQRTNEQCQLIDIRRGGPRDIKTEKETEINAERRKREKEGEREEDAISLKE